MRIWIIILLLMPYTTLLGQDVIYTFDVKDFSSYDTTCGKTTGSYWGVIDDSCQLTTSPTLIDSDCGDSTYTNVPVEVRINQSGNLNCDDVAVVEYTCGDGMWHQLDSLLGCNQTSNETYNYNAGCANGDSFQLRVRFNNDHSTEKWQIFDGDIDIMDACALLPIDLKSFELSRQSENLTFDLAVKSPVDNKVALQYSRDGMYFNNIAQPDASTKRMEEYTYRWELNNWSRGGYFRAVIHGEEGITHSRVIQYQPDSRSNLSMKMVGEQKLQILGGSGNGKLMITNLNGNKAKVVNINLNQAEVFSLPDNLHGFHIATLQTATERQTVKLFLR